MLHKIADYYSYREVIGRSVLIMRSICRSVCGMMPILLGSDEGKMERAPKDVVSSRLPLVDEEGRVKRPQ